MKSKLLLSILTLFVFTFTAAAQASEYIGYRHKGVSYGQTLPNGVKDLGGGLLSDDDYGVTRYSKGRQKMLWLEKITGRDARGVPSWVVKDVLVFDVLKKNQEFLFSYSSTCRQKGRPDLDLVVLAELNPKTKTYQVQKAWLANTQTEKFEVVSIRGVRCDYRAP